MFTGIITDIGTVTAVEARGDTRLRIACHYDMATVALGASVACSGVCLTVVAKGPDWFDADVSGETIACTAPGLWTEGRRINLERAMRIGDELGGHIVTGHVDGVGKVTGICPEGASIRIGVSAPPSLAPFIAAKGSITIDGVSLTVNDVADQEDRTAQFSLNIIPHTAAMTTLGGLTADTTVNLEIDVLARYLARMEQAKHGGVKV